MKKSTSCWFQISRHSEPLESKFKRYANTPKWCWFSLVKTQFLRNQCAFWSAKLDCQSLRSHQQLWCWPCLCCWAVCSITFSWVIVDLTMLLRSDNYTIILLRYEKLLIKKNRQKVWRGSFSSLSSMVSLFISLPQFDSFWSLNTASFPKQAVVSVRSFGWSPFHLL